MIAVLNTQQMSAVSTTLFLGSLVVYAAFILWLYFSSSVSRLCTFCVGSFFLVSSSVAVAAFWTFSTVAQAIAAKPGLAPDALLAALILNQKAQTYLLVISIIAGGTGANLVVHALTTRADRQRI